MDRIRSIAPSCSPAACCEAEAADDALDGATVDELSLSYGNWMSDVANRLWNIPLVRAPERRKRLPARAAPRHARRSALLPRACIAARS